jgi:nucleotide-binding universal stress UspA family protein
MYKQILAPVTGTAGDASVFVTALLVARAFDAHIEFLHARVDVTEVIVAMTAGGASAVQSVVDQLESDTKAQEQKAWSAFAEFCAGAGLPPGGGTPGAGISADMVVETGNESQWLTEYGRFADLIVVGRKRDSEEVAMDVLQAAVMDTGSPVLIAPAVAPNVLPGTLVIAWKDTPEAARAVAAAMPFIDRAARVVILSAGEGEGADDPSAHQLQRWLRWHNAGTSVQLVPLGDRSPVEALLGAAQELGAGLLVMGGYSHSQWREAVFGGVTQEVLRGADLPVLMAH